MLSVAPASAARLLVHRVADRAGATGLVRGLRSASTVLSDGTVLRHRNSSADRGVIRQIFVSRDYDLAPFRRRLEVERFYEECEQPLIVDCGANIGASALWFAYAFPRAIVHAIEPEKANFDLLRTNCCKPNIHSLQGAVAAQSGTVTLRDPGGGEWAFRAYGGGSGDELYDVAAYTIPDILARSRGTPFILKVDIEGAEAELFLAHGDVLDEFPLLIVELHDWMIPRGGTSRAFLQWHAARDRDFVYWGENVFSFSNSRLPRLE